MGSGFFGYLTYFWINLALTNKRGLLVDFIIHLSPHQANVFYGFFATLSALCALASIFCLCVGLAKQRFVWLTTNELSAPRFAFSWQNTVIRLTDILNVRVWQLRTKSGAARYITIRRKAGKIDLADRFFASPQAFDEFAISLQSIVRKQSQQPRPSLQ